MLDLFKAFRSIPEEKKIILFGKVNLIKDLLFFVFKITVGIIFHSWLLIALALYNMTIGLVKSNCVHGLKKKRDSRKDYDIYIRGGVFLLLCSVIFISYSIVQTIYPANTKYTLIIAIVIALFATINMVRSIVKLIKTKGKTVLVKEYRISSLAMALNGLVITQMAILSATTPADLNQYNSVFSTIIASIILLMGLYVIIDGVAKKLYKKVKR